MHRSRQNFGNVTVNPDSFRLFLAICAACLTLAYLASVDVALSLLAVILAVCAGLLWLCWRVIKWAWRNWG